MNDQIKLGIAPIGWSNDDMPELGGDISFEQCIQEMSAAGFQGCEVGHKFPRDPAALAKALAPYRLSIASGWYSLYFTESGREEESIAGFDRHMRFLHAMGAKVIVVCECGHSIQGQALPVFSARPRFSEQQWQALSSGLNQIGHMAEQNDMRIVYHPHMGTGVQQADEIDRLMSQTDAENVSLLLDTGHLAYAGESPLQVLNRHRERIRHVHLKDVREHVLRQVREQGMSFLDSVRAGVFTVPGDGTIDFKPVCDTLLQMHYSGWWVVEAEQDPAKANPLLYAKMARKFLREISAL